MESRLILAIGALLIFLPMYVGAVPEEGTIDIGITPDGWPPYVVVKDGDIFGIAMDVLRTICKGGGYDLRITIFPEKRADRLVGEGDIDAIFDAKAWTQEPEMFLWTDPIIYSEDLLIFRKDDPIIFDTVEDLFGKALGTRFDFVYPTLERYFLDGSIQRVDARNDIAMLNMVHEGRTNAAVINKWVALWKIRQNDHLRPADFAFSKQLIDRAGYCVMFNNHRNWKPFIEFFNAELRMMKQDGRYASIVAQYR